MSAAELRSTREFLGFSPLWMARHLKMSEREYVLMERDRAPIYRGVTNKVEELAEEVNGLIDQLVKKIERGEVDALQTYETDADYEYVQQQQNIPYNEQKPVRWHRHICARVADQIDVRIDYIPQLADRTTE